MRTQLERRGLTINTAEAMALKLAGGEQMLIPFGERAHLIWTRTNGQTSVLGLLRQGNKTLNLSVDGSERRVRMLEGAKAQRLLAKLRDKSKFREFEQKLREKGKRIAEDKLRVLLDETGNLAILGLPNEGSEQIAHQLRIRLKANKDDDLDDSAEPQIQATACGQASGDAVATAQGAQLQPQYLGDFGGSWGVLYDPEVPRSVRPQVCISQWGYTYLCPSTNPSLSWKIQQPLDFGVAIVGWQMQIKASLVVWNYGGGTLTGTATTTAPFSIVSGGSFSLTPGQPQGIVVRFAPTAAGDISGSVRLTSNGGNYDVPVKGRAYTFEEYLDLLIKSYNAVNEAGSQESGMSGIINDGDGDYGVVPPATPKAYGMISSWDDTKKLNLIVGGHPKLDRTKFLQMSTTATEQALNDVGLDPISKAFLAKIAALSPEELSSWFQLLAQAIRENRFDAEYARLLPQGLNKLQDAFLPLFNDTQDPYQSVKIVIRTMATMAGPLPPPVSLDQVAPPLRERLEKIATDLKRFFWILEVVGNPLKFIPGSEEFCQRTKLCDLTGSITVVKFLRHVEGISCNTVSSCIEEFIKTLHYSLTAAYRELGPQPGDALLEGVKRLLNHYTSGIYGVAFAQEFVGELWGVLHWMERGTSDLKDRLERGTGTILVAGGLVSNGWKNMGFVKSTYSYGTWWGARSYITGQALVSIVGKATVVDVVQVALVSGGDHCTNCAAKAQEIVAWVREAVKQVHELKDALGGPSNYNYTPRGVVSFAFTDEGAQGVFHVLDALRRAFRDSPTPIIVSWMDTSGQVWYMCIGSVAACDHLRNMSTAQQIACAQQWQIASCNPIEIMEPLPPPNDLPPSGNNKSMQSGGVGGSDP